MMFNGLGAKEVRTECFVSFITEVIATYKTVLRCTPAVCDASDLTILL